MIQDQIVVSKPIEVRIGVDRISDEVKKAEIVNTTVAQWWIPEGAELVLEPWIEEGIRKEGWKLTRKSGSHVVPEVEGDVAGVNWRTVAGDMDEALKRGDFHDAMDMHEIAVMQQAMVDEPEFHEHTWPADLGPDSMCEYPGCRLRHDEWRASQ